MLRNFTSRNNIISTTVVPTLIMNSRNNTTSAAPAADMRKLIQQLRARTDAPIMDCKKSLLECGTDDIEKCVEWLKKKGLASADKKLARETMHGVIAIATGPHGAAAIQLFSETDFTARNEKFLQLAADISNVTEKLIADNAWGPLASAENFSAEFHSKMIQPLIAQVGENIAVRKVIPLPHSESNNSNLIGFYTHGSSPNAPKSGTMVALSFLKTPSADVITPQHQEIANDISQTCVANYFVADVPPEQHALLNSSYNTGEEEMTIAGLTKKENLELCRLFVMSTSDADEPRNIVSFGKKN
jgi:translation elongation factor EF-Ts